MEVVIGAVRVLPVMMPLEASDITLDEIAGTAVTGHTTIQQCQS